MGREREGLQRRLDSNRANEHQRAEHNIPRHVISPSNLFSKFADIQRLTNRPQKRAPKAISVMVYNLEKLSCVVVLEASSGATFPRVYRLKENGSGGDEFEMTHEALKTKGSIFIFDS